MATTLTFTGDSNGAEKAIATLERKYADLENKIKKTSQSAKSGSGDWLSDLAKISSTVTGISSAFDISSKAVGSFGSALSKLIELNDQLNDKLGNVGDQTNELDVKLRIQGGISKEELEKQLPVIEQKLNLTPAASAAEAQKIQTQAASSGFKKEDVDSGEALGAILDTSAATNSFGEGRNNAADLTKSLSMLAKGSGIASPSAKDIVGFGKKVVSLFETSDLQSKDLEQLAPKMATLKNFGLSDDEALGNFSALVDVMGGNKADTALTKYVTSLGTIGAYPERKEALAGLGLKPEDVALAPGGKRIGETTDLLRDKLKGVPAERANEIISKIFGDEGGPAAALLTGSLNGKSKEYVEKSKDEKPFDRNVQTFRESNWANNQKNENKQFFEARKINDQTGNFTWSDFDKKKDADRMGRLADSGEAAGAVGRVGAHVSTMVEDAANWIPRHLLGLMPSDLNETRNGKTGPTTFENVMTRPFFGVADPATEAAVVTPQTTLPDNVSAGSGGAIAEALNSLGKKIEENSKLVDENNKALKSGTGNGANVNPGTRPRQLNRTGNTETGG